MEALLAEAQEVRRLTLDLVALAREDELGTIFHPDFSPVGWHLGHIAAFEAHCLLGRDDAVPPLWPEAATIFDPARSPKQRRDRLPPREVLLEFAAAVRARTTDALTRASSPAAVLERLRLALGHELQHAETIAVVLRFRSARRRAETAGRVPLRPGRPALPATPAVPLRFAGGSFRVGSDDALSFDNERPTHEVTLGPFEIGAAPVTHGQWLRFVEESGYRRRELWTHEGWRWREAHGVERPFYWEPGPEGLMLRAFTGDVPLPLDAPVEGISAHEAEAFARFSSSRLPSEFEWERAARACSSVDPAPCGAWRGAVWEWTSSEFAPYPGFSPGLYARYSQPWFDGRHRVLRGGSWATHHRVARPTFRNWFEPHWRAIFAGVRLARSL